MFKQNLSVFSRLFFHYSGLLTWFHYWQEQFELLSFWFRCVTLLSCYVFIPCADWDYFFFISSWLRFNFLFESVDSNFSNRYFDLNLICKLNSILGITNKQLALFPQRLQNFLRNILNARIIIMLKEYFLYCRKRLFWRNRQLSCMS